MARISAKALALLCVLAFVLGIGGYSGFHFLIADKSSQADDTTDRDVIVDEVGHDVPKESLSYSMSIAQVDNSEFPRVVLYTEILDESGVRVDQVDSKIFHVSEVGSDQKTYEASIESVAKLTAGDAMFVNLVLDRSASMDDYSRMPQAQSAANSFIDSLPLSTGTQVEVTSFNSYVSTPQPFSSDSVLLHSAINDMYPSGDTALNDALYHAVQRTNKKSGSRVVIAFTDGEENDSYHSVEDVKDIARQTGIPVYIIGVGNSVDEVYLRDLATGCNGEYYSASDSDLQAALSDIYSRVWESHQNMYKIVFRSNYQAEQSSFRTVKVICDGETEQGYVIGRAVLEYVPVDNVPEYDTTSRSADFLLPDVADRCYSRSELENFSLWELYLARNEIFARHGRIFTRQDDLNDYFMQKDWYRPIYTPDEFAELDARVKQLNEYEDCNAELMLDIERSRNSPYINK